MKKYLHLESGCCEERHEAELMGMLEVLTVVITPASQLGFDLQDRTFVWRCCV